MRSLQQAFRRLISTPVFTLTAVATLALGIGLSTAVFTVAEGLLLRRLPVREQERIVVLWGRTQEGFDHWPLDLKAGRRFSDQTRTLERVGFFAYEGAWPQPVRDDAGIIRLRRALVSGDFFGVLDAAPLLGRTLGVEDDLVGATPVVVLSHGAWRQHFGGSPEVLGRPIVLHESSVAYTVIGVMPQGLDFPRGTDFWAPLVPARARPGTDSVFAHVDLVGRLRPGMPIEAARDELGAFFRQPDAGEVETTLRPVATPLPRLITGEVRPAVIAFSLAVGLLLAISCLNVANLLLVRGLGRVGEMTLRSALGASRPQLVRQLLVEHAVLAGAGGLAGVVVGALAIRGFLHLAPASLPRLDQIGMSPAALAAAILATAVSLLLFGLAPAYLTSQVDAGAALRSGSRQSPGRRSRVFTEGLVAAQISLAVIVLAGAGLVTRSLLQLQREDLALEGSHLLIAELAYREDRLTGRPDLPAGRERQRILADRVMAAVRAMPGVVTASPVVAVPFAGTGGWDGRFRAEEQSPDEASANPVFNMEVVLPEYFQTLGIPVLAGRGFTGADVPGSPPVIILSESAARHFWPGADPVGRRLFLGREGPVTVAGVVPDTRYRDLRTARPSVYFPLAQSFFPFAPTNLAIRTSGPPSQLIPLLRHTLEAADPALGLASAAPFSSFLEAPLAQPRLNAMLLAGFALTALLLSAVGLFGVMATLVGQRTRELGIRIALGAGAGGLQILVFRRALAIAAAGLVAGLAGALAANQLLRALLYEVSPSDGLTLLLVAAGLLVVAILAAAVPARATTRIDPAIVLRSDG